MRPLDLLSLRAPSPAELSAERSIRLHVAGLGGAMDADTVTRIFQLFSSTTPSRQRASLGLSVMDGIVSRTAVGSEWKVLQSTAHRFALTCWPSQCRPKRPDDRTAPSSFFRSLFQQYQAPSCSSMPET